MNEGATQKAMYAKEGNKKDDAPNIRQEDKKWVLTLFCPPFTAFIYF